MMTTKTLYVDPAKNVTYRCPCCGHSAALDSFEYRLPSASRCVDGSRAHYEVSVPTCETNADGKPIMITEKFDHEPTIEQIAALVEMYAKPIVKPRRRKPAEEPAQEPAAEE